MKSAVLFTGSLFFLAVAPLAPALATNLQQQAHEQYVKGKYREAATTNLAILSNTTSLEKDRRYAMQMLGTIYENHLLNFDSAAYWYEKFSQKYTSGAQREFYRKKLNLLRGLGDNEKKGYSAIKKATYATEAPQKKIALLEAGLSMAPSLPNRKEVLLQISHTAFDAKQYAKARAALLELKKIDPGVVAGELRVRFSQVEAMWRYSIIARACWAFVTVLFVSVLLTVPYRKIARKSWKMLGFLCAAWIPIAAIGICMYLWKIHALVHNPFSKQAIFIAAIMLLVITFWIFSARFSLLHRISGSATIVVLPICSLLLAVASFFLFLYHQPKRELILEDFGERYVHWIQGTAHDKRVDE